MSEANQKQEATWERRIIEQLATDALKEKKRARRWSVFFKTLTFVYITAVILLWLPDSIDIKSIEKAKSHTALVELDDVIAAKDGVDAETIVEGLRDAFEDKKTKAVILRINSPGGSPVQSSYIQKEIVRLRAKHKDIPLYAVVTDICASGGYYVASAADKIFVNESSLVGSIGVLMNGFGFTEAMQELGIERRLLTAGDHKGILDPFSPLTDFDREHAKEMLDALHKTFIDTVKAGRGDRLADDEMLFSGLFWSGQRSIELGLADEIGSASYVAREIVGEKTIVDFTPKQDPIERLVERIGASAASSFAKITGLVSQPRF